jgi:hypothetical protein
MAEVQSLNPHVQSLLFKDCPLVTMHALKEVMTIVLSVCALPSHALIDVGVGENSGRATSLLQ